ncbi:metal-sensing transcriptional repressor [Methanobrevibacter woesei]|uniref:metal-sensing transcriptional repressor n=1 Tax=Methanobrevibacter woesei TaxID=190976 RepID=UPI0032085725
MKQCMDSENLHRRLKKIIGQLNAIDRMIDEDVPCENILMQINASKSALHKVGHIIVEGHLNHCIKDAIEKGNYDEALLDVSSLLEYYSRI